MPKTTICGLCDGHYDIGNDEDVEIHRHPEPQQGPYRDALLRARIPYAEWIATTPLGRQWAKERVKRREEPIMPTGHALPTLLLPVDFRLQRYDLAIVVADEVGRNHKLRDTREGILEAAGAFYWIHGYSYEHVPTQDLKVALKRVDELFPELTP